MEKHEDGEGSGLRNKVKFLILLAKKKSPSVFARATEGPAG